MKPEVLPECCRGILVATLFARGGFLAIGKKALRIVILEVDP
jgi:hypothetical protein